MECQKNYPLQATNDTEYIISDSFILEGQLTDLYLHPQQLRIVQKDKTRTIPFQFGLNFAILQSPNGQSIGLELSFGDSKVTLQRDFWPKAKQWENHLLKYVTRKDFHEFFRPLKKIGKGNFATVYLAEDMRSNRRVAIKAFMKEPAFKNDGKAAIENQVKLMRRVKHPNLVTLYGVYQTKNSLYLSMEYIQGLSLESFLRKNRNPTTQQRHKLLKGLLNGLKELSRLNIVHRDIKPENIIVSEDCQTVKIVDFGLATDINQSRYIFVRCGTPGFVAPQILKIKDAENARLGVESDMFSLGAILYHLIYGQPLFPGKNQNEVLALNRQCQIKLGPQQNVSYGQLELLCSMLQFDPSNRITPELALKSSFLQQKKDIFLRALQPIQVESTNEWIFEE